jgi:D-sedoheptulose 7-phosphate isomerase
MSEFLWTPPKSSHNEPLAQDTLFATSLEWGKSKDRPFKLRSLRSSGLVNRILGMTPLDTVRASFEEASRTLQAFRDDPDCLEQVDRFARAAHATLENGGKLMSCGNGGSMCDAMHFAEEWTGRFRGNRSALPAIAFSDPSQLTCIANDFGYEEVFARSVEAYGQKGDLFVAISTSGNSPNILRATKVARERGITVVGLLGKGGGKLRELVDIPIIVPLAETSDRIQEVHIKVLHIAIEAVERLMFPENY